ncbi:MAG TPA: ABC transporter [Elusimicrobia bacterium]|nr:ABC transporter [Elusimicrobiota bacterium]
MPALKAAGLTFSYGPRPLIKGLSFELRPGDFMCVLGANGSGKSTLLKLLTGFIKPAEGCVTLAGESTAGMEAGRLARLAAYVPSETTTPYDFSVRETVLMGRTARSGFWRGYSAADEEAADRALEETGADRLAGRSINTLSSGERQLVFIAQALAQEAKLLLLDEPTSHLDLKYKAAVMNLLASLAARNMAVAAVLHEPALARLGCNKALLMGREGKYNFGSASEMIRPARLAAVYGLPENSPLLQK